MPFLLLISPGETHPVFNYKLDLNTTNPINQLNPINPMRSRKTTINNQMPKPIITSCTYNHSLIPRRRCYFMPHTLAQNTTLTLCRVGTILIVKTIIP